MLLDPELGIKPEDKEALDVYGSVPEKVEEHQAEEPPLVWSDERKTWATRTDNPEASTTRASIQTEETTVPTPLSASEGNIDSSASNEPIYVQFADHDPDNPFDWSLKRKWTITILGNPARKQRKKTNLG